MKAPLKTCDACGLKVATTMKSGWLDVRKHVCEAPREPSSRQLVIRPGDVFGSWVVIAENTERQHRAVMYNVRCSCGVNAIVPGRALVRGTSASCLECGKIRAGMVKRDLHASARTARQEFRIELLRLLALQAGALYEEQEWKEWFDEERERFITKWAPAYSLAIKGRGPKKETA